jgi:hypothetical protein
VSIRSGRLILEKDEKGEKTEIEIGSHSSGDWPMKMSKW